MVSMTVPGSPDDAGTPVLRVADAGRWAQTLIGAGWSDRDAGHLAAAFPDADHETRCRLLVWAAHLTDPQAGLVPEQVQEWLAVLFTAAGVLTEFVAQWRAREWKADQDIAGFLPVGVYVAAAGGDHTLARLAVCAELSAGQLATGLGNGMLSESMLRVLAAGRVQPGR